MIRSKILAAAIAAAACPCAAIAAPPTYVATPIPTLGGANSNGAAISAAGHVTGYSYLTGNVQSHAFLFSGGVTTDLGAPGGAQSSGTGINRHGQVVGNRDVGGLSGIFLYSGGVTQPLSIQPGLNISGDGINDRGAIVGSFQPVPGGTFNAYLLVNGVFTDLVGLEPWGGSWSDGINNRGEVVGHAYVAGGMGLRAFRYSNGVMQEVGLPGTLISIGSGINEQGQITGSTQQQGGSEQAFIANNNVPTVIGGLQPLGWSAGYSINLASQVVGAAQVASVNHGFLYDSGTMYDLNTLVVNGLGGRVINAASRINDSGQIVANACIAGPTLDCRAVRLDPFLPGRGTIAANPYGSIGVTGGTLAGSTITITSGNSTLQLGTSVGAPGSRATIDFDGLNLAPGTTLTVRSGAPGQTLVLNNVNANASMIAGSIIAAGGNGAPPPVLELRNPRGIAVATEGRIVAPSGLVLDALAATPVSGQGILNFGIVDGGTSLQLRGAGVNGGGDHKGNAIRIATFGNVNNPVHGAHYLANGLKLTPSTGGALALTLNGYGVAPQVFNVAVQGNAVVSMPSAWPAGDTAIPNNAPVLSGQFRPAGVPDPAYGGGSMIVQATGSLTLNGGTPNNFVFPGGLVLKAGTTLDFAGVDVNNGWTTSGQPWQGQFHEAATITSSSGPIVVHLSDLNWVNFSVMPAAPVRAFHLVRLSNGAAQFVAADAVAPHLNTYSSQVEAAANGECWTCLINATPVDMY